MKVYKRDAFAIWASKCMGRLQARLHVSPSHIVLLEWVTCDAQGKPIYKVEQKSHSFTRNYHNICACNAIEVPETLAATYGATGLQPKSTGAVVAAGTTLGLLAGVGAGAGVVTTGIVAGTGTNAESIEDYVLQTPIAHGVGANQLSYGAETVSLTYLAKVWTSVFSRLLTNSSGGAITIREIGMYKGAFQSTIILATSAIYCLIRDTSDVNIAVANGGNTTITYTMTYTFP
jgi:hypothetical protein